MTQRSCPRERAHRQTPKKKQFWLARLMLFSHMPFTIALESRILAAWRCSQDGLQGKLAMKIRCPNCGRMGYLPDHLVPAAHSLRCRKCQANFPMPELSLQGMEPRFKEVDSWRGTTLEPPVASRTRENPTVLLADGFVAGYDEAEASPRELGAGDSQYELTIALKESPGYSSDDWSTVPTDVLEPEAPSSDEIEAVRPAVSGLSYPEPMSYRFIASWIRPLFFVSLVFVAFSALLIGFLLMRSLELGGSPILPLARHALVIASVGILSFLLFGLWMVFLSVVLADLAQSLRRLRDMENGGRGR
jgi:hypothetical protein